MTKSTKTLDVTRDWENLPPELVYLISRKLGDLAFYIPFRAICKAWRSAAPLSDPPRQLPWLRIRYNYNQEFIKFYSITSEKIYNIPFPRHQYLVRNDAMHSQQYLLADDSSEGSGTNTKPDQYHRSPVKCGTSSIFLVNPITHRSIPVRGSYGSVIQIGPTKVENEEDLVIISMKRSASDPVLGFYKLRDEEWKIGPRPYIIDNYVCAYYKGMAFLNRGYMGVTDAFDLTKKEVAYSVPVPQCQCRSNFSQFIESSGELLGVRQCKHETNGSAVRAFNVYRLKKEKTNQWRWEKMNDIGDRILVVFLNGGFSFRASEVGGGHKGNCIYYKMDRDLIRYDIEKQSFEKKTMHCFFDPSLCDDADWFVPSI